MTDRWRCKSIPTNCLTSYSSIGASYDSWNVNTPASAGNVTRSGGPAPSSHQVGEFAWSLPRSAVVTAASSSYKGHRYPREIVAHCVWLYHRFPLGPVKLIGGLIVRALCVGSGGKPCPSSRSGGGRGNPGDLVPDGEAVGHLVAPSVGRQQMPPRTEMWRDAAERGQQPLRMPGRGEPFHRPLALPGRLMRVLGRF